MAVWSEVSLHELGAARRCDAEFFQPEFIQAEEKARRGNMELLGNLALSIARGTQPEYIEGGEYLVLRSVNVQRGFLNDTRQEYVSAEFFMDNPRGQVQYGDVLMTSTGVGTLGRVTYNYSPDAHFADGHIAIMRDWVEVDPQYVALFLQTPTGIALIERRYRGSSGQIEIYPDDISSIPIPRFKPEEEGYIAALCRKSQQRRKDSQILYAEAEAILLDTLGLNAPIISNEIGYEREFSQVMRAERFDAQFFHPYYQNAMEILRQQKTCLGDVALLARRQFKAERGQEFQYIEIGDLSGAGMAQSTPIDAEEAPSRAQWVVMEGDVITSTVRPIRRLSALIEPYQAGYVCSSGFAVLEPQTVPPELLLLYLRLPIIAEILDLHTTATMYPAIATDVLMKIPFSAPSEEVVKDIVGKVSQSRQAYYAAQHLLEEAKERVESMIAEAA
ncbi:hypothetical protein EON83_20650 [bacterium]|nr:MAG: hypothetical protein EON83_20650 [bacterium]